jgi:hypothetical protein
MKEITKTNLLIHLFALAHVLVVLMFALAHMNDDVPLSILTILLIVLVADQYGFPLEVSTALALLFCIAGFFIGTKGAELINMIFNFEEKTITNIIMTFVTTEILGWSTYFIVKNRPDDNITK